MISEGVTFFPMPNRANTMSNDDSNAAIKFMLGSGKRPSSHMLVTFGSLSLLRPAMHSGLIRYSIVVMPMNLRNTLRGTNTPEARTVP